MMDGKWNNLKEMMVVVIYIFVMVSINAQVSQLQVEFMCCFIV